MKRITIIFAAALILLALAACGPRTNTSGRSTEMLQQQIEESEKRTEYAEKVAAELLGEATQQQEAAVDYESAASFEAALNSGADLIGSTVQFTVSAIVPDSAFGYNLQTGEHLNFCSSDNPGVSVGDTVIVEVVDVTKFLGSYIVRYDLRSMPSAADNFVAEAALEQTEPTEAPGLPEPVLDVQPEEKGSPIDVFSYRTSGDSVLLQSYVGRSTRVEIDSSYVIDGQEYKTDLSDFQVGLGSNSVETLILKDGITEVAMAIFNCSDVQNVFFPSSMTLVYDYTLSYLHPEEDGERIKVFYEGTQDEWQQIFTEYHRTAVGDAEFGAELGTALADALNEKIGTSYDSSQFEFYFSVTPDMVP